MAPAKKGAKREAGIAVPAAKKARIDPAVEGVLDVIAKAVDLPETVRKMLEASVPLGLCTPQNERHQVQDAVVAMIGEVVESFRAKLVEALDTENSKLGGLEGRRAELQVAVMAFEEVVATVWKDTEENSDTLRQATELVTAAKGILQEKQQAQLDGDAAMMKARDSKAALERGIEEDLCVIVAGSADNVTDHYEALLPVLHGFALDDSLMSALPSVCSKKASERGAFDNMVLEQLGQSLRDHIAALAKIVEDASPAAQERETAVQEAMTKVDEASVAQDVATRALGSASAALQVAEQELKVAKDAFAAFEPEYKDATSARDECVQKLGNFKEYNVRAFELLRDKVTAGSATAGGA